MDNDSSKRLRGSGLLLIWGITKKSENRVIGSVCYWNVSILKEAAEIGYELMVEWQGKGVMQEVMPAMIQYGFKSMGLQCIEATPQRNDPKSWRILERFGFVKALEKEQVDTPYLFYFWGKKRLD